MTRQVDPAIQQPADAAAPAPLRRFGGFEAYRGIAAVLVVVFHGYQYTGESYGEQGPRWAHVLLYNLDSLVDLFFVLSAFLLTLPWIRATLDGTRTQSARGYLTRRAIRILPVYWVVILVVWAGRNPGLPGDWRDLLEHLTFTQVFDSRRIFYTVGPAWSLAVEVLFYVFLLVVGLTLELLCQRLRSRAARLAAWTAVCLATIAATAAWLAWSMYVREVPFDHWSTWFGPAAKAGVFGAGMLLAVVVAALPAGWTLPTPVPALLRLAGLGLTAWTFVWRVDGVGRPPEQWSHLIFAAAFALVLAGSALARPDSPWERTLESRPLVTLGLISYSVYLWHEPLLLLLGGRDWVLTPAASSFIPGTAMLVVVSLVVGWLSYWCIEHPVASMRTRLDKSGRLRPLYDQ
jgi:peptidoglycan/LPS O-acetylase OafA/YrhL